MNKSIACLGICLAVFLVWFVPSGSGYPEPSLMQDVGEWTLDAEYEHPRQIMIQLPGQARPQRFWYMILTVTNNTGQEVEFFPVTPIFTDTFQLVKAGTPAGGLVFDTIKRVHAMQYPFLEYIEDLPADERVILPGEDNTRDFAIIWPDFDPNAKHVSIFIEGLSNETEMIMHPRKTDEMGMPVPIYLRKTLKVDYSVGGDPALRSKMRMKYMDDSWVMR